MIDGEDDLMTVLSTISCELYHAFEHWNWVGFYRRADDENTQGRPLSRRTRMPDHRHGPWSMRSLPA